MKLPFKVCDSGNEADEEGPSEASSSVSSFSVSVDDVDENGATEDDEYYDGTSTDQIPTARKKIKPTSGDRRNLRKTLEAASTKHSRKSFSRPLESPLHHPPRRTTGTGTTTTTNTSTSYQFPRKQIYRAIFRYTVPLPEPPAESDLGSGFESNDELTELETSFHAPQPTASPLSAVSPHHSQLRNHFHPTCCHQQHTRGGHHVTSGKAKTKRTSSGDETGGEGDVEDLDEPEEIASRQAKAEIPLSSPPNDPQRLRKTQFPDYTYAKSTPSNQNQRTRNHKVGKDANLLAEPSPPLLTPNTSILSVVPS